MPEPYIIRPADDPENASAPKEEPGPSYVTGFLVLLDDQGHWVPQLNLNAVQALTVHREPTVHDVVAAGGAIQAEALAGMTAMTTASVFSQQAAAMQQHMEAQRIAAMAGVMPGGRPNHQGRVTRP